MTFRKRHRRLPPRPAVQAASSDLIPIYDALVSVLTAEQTYRNSLVAQVADLTAQLEDCDDSLPPEPPEGSTRTGFGYYQQGTDLEAIYGPQEDRWNREIDRIVCFTPNATSWSTMALQSWWLEDFGEPASRWAADYGTVISLQLVPQGESVTSATTSEVYQAFKGIGQALVSAGLGHSILRIGWEHTGTWYPWSSVGKEADFAAKFKDAVNGCRDGGGSGQAFLFDWNVAGGKKVNLNALPSNDYVDVLSIDLYDAPDLDLAEQIVALDQIRDLAEDRGLDWAIPEWGLWGVEDTGYTNQMTDYITEYEPLYQGYFDVSSSSDHRLSKYPASEDIFAAWAPTAP
jgi:hypothetical protein